MKYLKSIVQDYCKTYLITTSENREHLEEPDILNILEKLYIYKNNDILVVHNGEERLGSFKFHNLQAHPSHKIYIIIIFMI